LFHRINTSSHNAQESPSSPSPHFLFDVENGVDDAWVVLLARSYHMCAILAEVSCCLR
jgi:hypothetical protein